MSVKTLLQLPFLKIINTNKHDYRAKSRIYTTFLSLLLKNRNSTARPLSIVKTERDCHHTNGQLSYQGIALNNLTEKKLWLKYKTLTDLVFTPERQQATQVGLLTGKIRPREKRIDAVQRTAGNGQVTLWVRMSRKSEATIRSTTLFRFAVDATIVLMNFM